jgi:hypothetical protein
MQALFGRNPLYYPYHTQRYTAERFISSTQLSCNDGYNAGLGCAKRHTQQAGM